MLIGGVLAITAPARSDETNNRVLTGGVIACTPAGQSAQCVTALILSDIAGAVRRQVAHDLVESGEWFVVVMWVKPFASADSQTVAVYNSPRYGMVKQVVNWDSHYDVTLAGCSVNGFLCMTECHSDSYFPYSGIDAAARAILCSGIYCCITLNRPAAYLSEPAFAIGSAANNAGDPAGWCVMMTSSSSGEIEPDSIMVSGSGTGVCVSLHIGLNPTESADDTGGPDDFPLFSAKEQQDPEFNEKVYAFVRDDLPATDVVCRFYVDTAVIDRLQKSMTQLMARRTDGTANLKCSETSRAAREALLRTAGEEEVPCVVSVVSNGATFAALMPVCLSASEDACLIDTLGCLEDLFARHGQRCLASALAAFMESGLSRTNIEGYVSLRKQSVRWWRTQERCPGWQPQ